MASDEAIRRGGILMTENNWLASENPAAMLDFATHATHNNAWHHERPSDRKLRLFACAVARHVYGPLHPDRRRVIEIAESVADDSQSRGFDKLRQARKSIDAVSGWIWCATCPDIAVGLRDTVFYERDGRTREAEAVLLREIVGNPFRPYRREKDIAIRAGDFLMRDSQGCYRKATRGEVGPVVAMQTVYAGDQTVMVHSPTTMTTMVKVGTPDLVRESWLTPTVLSLAEAAYEERGRKCYRCGGNKTNRVAVNRDHTKHQNMPCSDCNGTGTIDDGTLDAARLAVLSDALEEAGCDDEAILSHLRTGPTDEHSPRCGTAFRGCAPECPKDRAERQGPHVRGCWVIDLLLGRQ